MPCRSVTLPCFVEKFSNVSRLTKFPNSNFVSSCKLFGKDKNVNSRISFNILGM
ncbi:hypothetical protein YC2023_025830 [Brassica napus]